ncbi:MAG TPA: hypothetical protein VES64_04420 [Allosphingosinicella sp.]|nr:hypothetical protein [Allosphingosinicella sp.]
MTGKPACAESGSRVPSAKALRNSKASPIRPFADQPRRQVHRADDLELAAAARVARRQACKQRHAPLPVAAIGDEIAVDHRRIVAAGLAGAAKQVARLFDFTGPQPCGRLLEQRIGVHVPLLPGSRPTSRACTHNRQRP